MTQIVHLQTIPTSHVGQPESLADIREIDVAFCDELGLNVHDLHDEFGSNHLCGYVYGRAVYVCVPDDHEEVEGGSRVTGWLVYCMDEGKTRPVTYAQTEKLADKIREAIERREQAIQAKRKQNLRLVAA